jgi:DNA polymerase III subunit epsilon
MKRVFVDTETTGLDPHKNGIHQIAAILELEDGTTDELSLRVAPFPVDAVSQQALDVAGVTAEQVAGYMPPGNAHAKLLSFLGRHIDKFSKVDKAQFMAYKASFDAEFLRAWFGKCEDKYYGSWFWTPPVDIMSIAADRLCGIRPEMPDFKLATVAAALGIKVDADATHDAMYDVRLARDVYRMVG